MASAAGSSTASKLLKEGGQRAFSSGSKRGNFASSYAQKLSKEERQEQCRKRAEAREKRKHDTNLRLAIDLYHTSRHFFPSMATLSKQKMIGLPKRGAATASSTASSQEENPFELKGSADKSGVEKERARSLNDQLDWMIRKAFLVGTASNLEPVNMRTAAMVLDAKEREQVDYLRFPDANVEEGLLRYDRTQDTLNKPFTANEETPLPPRDDPDAIRRYLSEAMRNTAKAGRQTTRLYDDHSSLDNRSARVRDALYGTVGGFHPGLEAVRERSQEQNVQREAERLGRRSAARLARTG